MKFRWTTAPSQPLLAQSLASALKISPLLAQCLINRGLSDPPALEKYLAPRLKHLADPFLLPNMNAAVDRLLLAHRQNEPLVIFGDYDVDGVTSTTLLLEVLRRLGWRVEAYLPRRMDEGYGLSRDGVENCLARFPVKLLLAVDCGSTAVETIAWLRDRAVEVIVLDHHQVSNPPPAAVALVNPQLAATSEIANCKSPIANFQELCSAGLAFKLAHALLKRGRETGLPGAAEFDLKPLLDLVALGTIADLVPLTADAVAEPLTNSSHPTVEAGDQVFPFIGPGTSFSSSALKNSEPPTRRVCSSQDSAHSRTSAEVCAWPTTMVPVVIRRSPLAIRSWKISGTFNRRNTWDERRGYSGSCANSVLCSGRPRTK